MNFGVNDRDGNCVDASEVATRDGVAVYVRFHFKNLVENG